MNKIKPQILKGTRDFLPSSLVTRQYVIGVIKDNFERFGFEPLETPVLEYAETLEGKYGEEGNKLIYKFEDQGGRRVALRYDLTVPLSRVMAMYPELSKPFRRYQIAPVWRADKPQKGRYREFWQCDADIVGSPSMLADAEIITLVYLVLKQLGFKKFRIRINNRKILNALAQSWGLKETESLELWRSMDKLEKMGLNKVERELKSKGFSPQIMAKLPALLQLKGEEAEKMLWLKKEIGNIGLGKDGILELEEIFQCLEGSGVEKETYILDPSLARGLDYYTGPIFETVIEEAKIGSVSGGGRFDQLIGSFTGQSLPATGTSLGLERIITAMEELKLLPSSSSLTKVLVTIFEKDLRKESLKLVTELRQTGINSEVYLKEDKLGKQLNYAHNKKIPWVLILGPEEIAKGEVIVRDMSKGEQKAISRREIVEVIKQKLANSGPP